MIFRKNIKKCPMFFFVLFCFVFFQKKDRRARCNFQTVFQLLLHALYQLFGPKNLRYKSSLVKKSAQAVETLRSTLQRQTIWILCYCIYHCSPLHALRDDSNNGCIADYYHCDQKRFLEEVTFFKKHTEQLKYDNTHSKLCKLVKCLETCGVTTPVNTFVLCVKF